MAVCGVVAVAFIMPVYLAGTCRHYAGTTTVYDSLVFAIELFYLFFANNSTKM